MNLYCRLYIVMFIKTYQRILLGNGSTWTHPQHQLWPTWQRMLAQKISKRCSCGIFSLFKSHLWFKCVLKNPREIRFFTLKKKKKSKDVILEIRNWGQSFVVFVKIGRPEKKSIPYFWIISNHAVFSAKLDGSFVDATVLRIVSVEFHPFVWGLMSP